MKSTSLLANERVLGNPGRVAGGAADPTSKFKAGLSRINQELWLVLSLFVIAALFNWLVESHRMILGLYTLPTIFSAYVYGRRHASVCVELCGVVGDRDLGVHAGDYGLRDGNAL
jgi:hypothetical protein